MANFHCIVSSGLSSQGVSELNVPFLVLRDSIKYVSMLFSLTFSLGGIQVEGRDMGF